MSKPIASAIGLVWLSLFALGSTARAGASRALDLVGFPTPGKIAGWSGTGAGDDFAVVTGSDNEQAILVYDGQRLVLTRAACPDALVAGANVAQACAKVPAPRGELPVVALQRKDGASPVSFQVRASVAPAPVPAPAPAPAAAPPAAAAAAPPAAPLTAVEEAKLAAYRAAFALAGRQASDTTAHNEYDRDTDFAFVMYDETGQSYGVVPQVDEDDTIAIAIVSSDANQTVSDLRVTKCAPPSEVRIGGGGGVVLKNAAEAPPVNQPPPPPVVQVAKDCRSEDGFEATFKNGKGDTIKVSIPTLSLNRFTVGLGIFFDTAVSSSFSATAVKGQTPPVIVEDRHMGGLSTAAFVALRFRKVDSVRVRNTIGQWFSLAAGVSLTAPTDHLYLALNLEPLPGFAFLVGYHAFRDQRLVDGFAVGDALQAGAPPTDKKWVWWGDSGIRLPLFLGVNMDSSLLKNILAAINK